MKRTVVLSFCLLLLLGAASFAQGFMEMSITAGINNADKYIAAKDKLGLSDGQVAKLKGIKDDLGQKNAALMKETNEMNKGIMDLMRADDPDLAQVEIKLNEYEKVQSDIMLNKFAAAKDANKILTKEQKGKWLALQAERRAAIKNRMPPAKFMRKGK